MDNTKKRKIRGVIVGYGNRGQVYADYTFDSPDEFEIVGVVDVNDFKLQQAKERYKLDDSCLFKTIEDFLKAKVSCDIVINSTMDQLHYETALKILNAKYDMLIEKPIVPNKEQLLQLQRTAIENGCRVFVCHVLRYTPYFVKIKELINSGEIGDIVTMEVNEHVSIRHFATSYVRGKWRNESECGSGFLLAKSCHDLDIICWLNNATVPQSVVSFGNRSQFVKVKQPEDASEYCYQCIHKDTCLYSAVKMYGELNVMPFLVWDRMNKPLDEITLEEKAEYLKSDVYGRCIYDIPDADLSDRQNILISFANGSVCSFTLIGGATKADRYVHIVGTKGEIEGKLNEAKIVIRKASLEKNGYTEEIIDVSPNVVSTAKYGGHNGGDYAIMHDLCRYLNGDQSSLSITSLNDSVNGHLCVFAAEQSKKEKKIVDIS